MKKIIMVVVATCVLISALTTIGFCSDSVDPNPPHIIKPIEYTIVGK